MPERFNAVSARRPAKASAVKALRLLSLKSNTASASSPANAPFGNSVNWLSDKSKSVSAASPPKSPSGRAVMPALRRSRRASMDSPSKSMPSNAPPIISPDKSNAVTARRCASVTWVQSATAAAATNAARTTWLRAQMVGLTAMEKVTCARSVSSRLSSASVAVRVKVTASVTARGVPVMRRLPGSKLKPATAASSAGVSA